MQVTVSQKACVRCGVCAGVCPAVFAIDEGESARAVNPEVPEGYQVPAQAAADTCPTGAINIIL